MVSKSSLLIAAPTSLEAREQVQNVMEKVCGSCITQAPSPIPSAQPGMNV
jgi:hypothetical protein